MGLRKVSFRGKETDLGFRPGPLRAFEAGAAILVRSGLFLQSGFDVEDLIELRVPDGVTTTYQGYVPQAWARRWPAENIWVLRRRAG